MTRLIEKLKKSVAKHVQSATEWRLRSWLNVRCRLSFGSTAGNQGLKSSMEPYVMSLMLVWRSWGLVSSGFGGRVISESKGSLAYVSTESSGYNSMSIGLLACEISSLRCFMSQKSPQLLSLLCFNCIILGCLNFLCRQCWQCYCSVTSRCFKFDWHR